MQHRCDCDCVWKILKIEKRILNIHTSKSKNIILRNTISSFVLFDRKMNDVKIF